MKITLQQAVEVCQHLEPRLAEIGFHCGLTGGCLYRGGSDKDVDIIIYPHDPANKQPDETLQRVLTEAGFTDRYVTDENYVNRIVWICGYKDMRIDFFIS